MSYVSIYTLSNPADNIVRYVGRTKGTLRTRLIQHLSEARIMRSRNKRVCWIKGLMNQGVSLIIEEIDSVSEDVVSFYEKHYIKLFKAMGARLVNDTEGGEGVKGRAMTEENRRNLSNALKGRIFSEEHKRRLGESNTRRAKNGHTISSKAKQNIRNSSTTKKPILMFDLNGNFIKRFEGIRICSDEIKIDSSNICQCLKGKSSRAKQYIFKYA